MIIETKFDIDDEVWYLNHENKITSSTIISIDIFAVSKITSIIYKLVNGLSYRERKLFKSKELLISGLKGEVMTDKEIEEDNFFSQFPKSNL